MIKSMTGFGKGTVEFGSKKINVEIRSLNSKQMDLSVRMASLYREKELAYRSYVAKEMGRGKVEVNIYAENQADTPTLKLNKALALNYHNELKELANTLGENKESLLKHILQLPDVLKAERQEVKKEEWDNVFKTLQIAIAEINKFRLDEGAILGKELTLRVHNIQGLLKQVEPFEQERIDTVKARIKGNLEGISENVTIDNNRFEQEMIYYIEKLDITEEKVRLTGHCNYFLETMEMADAQGKKLGFITQEMGREINTLGSKSNHSEMQKVVVQMKDELEKIKEQVLNVM